MTTNDALLPAIVLQRKAIVYVRQSSPQQVLEHRESAALQYDLARRALARVGVHQVSGGGRCTQREATDFFSFRREGGRTGRMATLAWLAPATITDPRTDRVLT